jgi:hypothetical protein
MRGGVFSKNIWEGASERRNENIIVSGTLKMSQPLLSNNDNTDSSSSSINNTGSLSFNATANNKRKNRKTMGYVFFSLLQ